MVYRLTPPQSGHGQWTEEILHNFNGPDGMLPAAPVTIGSDGSIYGTTLLGGARGEGVVFKLANLPGWPETLLHNFGQYEGGWLRTGVVFGSDGLLYGTTSDFAQTTYADTGIDYSVSPLGDQVEYRVLHTFDRGQDGVFPVGIAAVPPEYYDGFVGATMLSASPPGVGEIYALQIDAAQQTNTTLYKFGPTPDVNSPLAPPIVGIGAIARGFYGTGQLGGTHGLGGVYRIALNPDRSVTESVLYNFGDQAGDPHSVGSFENAPLLQINSAGELIGVTSAGGTYGDGAFFELVPPATAGGAWTEKVDVSFDLRDPNGGSLPEGTPLKYGAIFYGTLSTTSMGYGAVYELTP